MWRLQVFRTVCKKQYIRLNKWMLLQPAFPRVNYRWKLTDRLFYWGADDLPPVQVQAEPEELVELVLPPKIGFKDLFYF